MSDEVKLTWGKTENDLLQRWPKSADGTPEEPALLTVARTRETSSRPSQTMKRRLKTASTVRSNSARPAFAARCTLAFTT